MKKFISICITLMMILTTVPVISFAAGEISIISPEPSIYSDLSHFKVACSLSAKKIIFKLDGVIVGETNGETSLSVPNDLLSVGNHTLEAIAIYPDDTASSDTKPFKVSAMIEKLSHSDAGELSGFSIRNNSNVVYEDTVGSSGQPADKAKILRYTINDEDKSSKPEIKNSNISYITGGIKKLSFDLKLTTTKDALFIDGMDAPMNRYAQLNSSNGYWLDGSASKYPATEKWMHIDIVSDSYANKATFSVDGIEIYNGTITKKQTGTLGFRLYQYSNRTESTRASMSLDNLFASQVFLYSLESVEWADSEGVWSDNLSSISTDTSKIRIKMNEALVKESVTKNTVKVYSNGREVSLTDASYDEASGYVIASLAETLTNESHIVFEMSEEVKLKSTNEASGESVKAILKTEAGTYSVSDIDCKINSAALLTNRQLKTGQTVSVDLNLNNQSAETKKMAAFVCVFQNKKLLAIGACEENVSPSGKNTTITLPELATIDENEEISIKVMVCESLSNPQAYANYYELK